MNMLDVFKTYNWMREEAFELGDPNLVIMADGYYSYTNGHWSIIATDKDLRRRISLSWRYTSVRPLKFDLFLEEILSTTDGVPLPDREQLTDLIWELLGYCMVTHTRYEQCFILCGMGANGKSVLGAVAKEMVGRKYTCSVQPSQMDSVFQRSNLEGKLLNLVTELNQNEELADGMLKAIVSGEMMSVERKHQDVREIEPFAKHIILTNHLPRIRDYSDGLFRRVSIIPLQRQFLGETADPHLLEKLRGEMDAIASRAMDADELNALCVPSQEVYNTNNTRLKYSHNISRKYIRYTNYTHWPTPCEVAVEMATMVSCEHTAATSLGWAAFDWAEHCIKQERKIKEDELCEIYVLRQWVFAE